MTTVVVVLYIGRLPRNRHEPLLVECVETLKEQANGQYSDLAIVEVEGFKYRIDEYDGMEMVESKLLYKENTMSDEFDNPWRQRVKELECRLEELEAKFNEAVEGGSNVEGRINDLESSFETFKEYDLSNMDSRIDDLEESVSNLDSRVDNLQEVDASEFDRKIDAIENDVSSNESRITDLEGRVSDLE